MKKWANTARHSLPGRAILAVRCYGSAVPGGGGGWQASSSLGRNLIPLPQRLSWRSTRAALAAVAAGLSLLLVALALAVFMDRHSWLKQALYPLLIISQTIPIIALAPLFSSGSAWGSHGIVVVALVCFFPWPSTWWRS